MYICRRYNLGPSGAAALWTEVTCTMDEAALDDLLADTGDAPPTGLAPLCVRVHRITQAQAERVCKWASRLNRVDVLCDVRQQA